MHFSDSPFVFIVYWNVYFAFQYNDTLISIYTDSDYPFGIFKLFLISIPSPFKATE
jgi:hypothetical protein